MQRIGIKNLFDPFLRVFNAISRLFLIVKIRSFQDGVHNNPEAEALRGYAHAALNYKTVRERMCLTPLGFCLRVFVNEKLINLEKTTSSIYSICIV